MTIFCSKCLQLVNESEFRIPGMVKVPYTIKDGNLLCHNCYMDRQENK